MFQNDVFLGLVMGFRTSNCTCTGTIVRKNCHISKHNESKNNTFMHSSYHKKMFRTFCLLERYVQYTSCADACSLVVDLYWIDYFGDIPQNSVKAGVDQNFKPVYVGQAFIQNKEIVPVAIHPGNPVVQFPNYGRTYETQNYVKVSTYTSRQNRLHYRHQLCNNSLRNHGSYFSSFLVLLLVR